MRGVRLIEFAVWAGPFTARRPQEAYAPPRRTAKPPRPPLGGSADAYREYS